METDPLSELIEELIAPAASTPTGTQESAMDAVANLIPSRTGTQTEDLSNSTALRAFREAYVAGRIEADVIKEGLSILRQVLVMKGLLV